MSECLAEALALWGLPAGDCTFVAGRENRVWRVGTPQGACALRLRRPGYRSEAELRSELDWLAALDHAGLPVPRPLPSRHRRLLERLGEGFADVLGWLPGRPMGQSRRPLDLADRTGTFRALGESIARLHQACDAWTPPTGFRRCRWDAEGLVGEAPVWGRFWDNPTLDTPTRALFLHLRDAARERLAGATPDVGLIHADLVRENLLLDGATIRLIDFDDGGFGYRLFDLATVLLKSIDEPDFPALRAALIAGYHAHRSLDLSHLDLFIVLRALTYVGWIVPRMAEPGGAERNARFVAEARALCAGWLRDHRAFTGGGEA
ncbi:MAG: phosphotransferase enzyme family protein [Tabrizicola sp.]